MALALGATLATSPVFASVAQSCTDADWLSLGELAPVGTVLDSPRCPRASTRMAALGFERLDDERWVRRVDLSAPETLVLSSSPQLPGVDAVAIISVDRRNGQLPYIYGTLRSLLRELPRELVINVLVGDDYTGYVSYETLVHQLGKTDAARVHVIATTSAIAAFLNAHYDVFARATWNHARALRAKRGPGHLLLFEDDVELSTGATRVLARHLEAGAPPLVSLYNFLCGYLPYANRHDTSSVRLIRYNSTASPIIFGRAQGLCYAADFAQQAGDNLTLRLGDNPLDTMIDAVLRADGLHIGFVQPSMLQHRGRATTGLGVFHESPCYFDVYPQR